MYLRKAPKWKTLFSPRNILYQREDNDDAATIATVSAAHRRQRSRHKNNNGNIGSSSCSGCSCSGTGGGTYYRHSSDEEQPSEQFDYCTRPPSSHHHHHCGSQCHNRPSLKYYLSGRQTIFAYMLHLVRLRYQRSLRLQWWYVLYPLLILITAGALLLSFGTLYSHVTAHDPCEILAASTAEGTPLLALSSSSSSSAALAAMPKLFHYQSKSSALSEETQSWKQLLEMEETESQVHPNIRPKDNGEWSSVYWSDESCAALVRDHFPSFWPLYMNYSHSIQRVDSCRYFIMYKYGGIYADTDISFHSNATTLERLVPHGVGLVESPYRYNERWQNSLMSAKVVQHPFWETVLETMIERANYDKVLSSTGPKMIGDAVQRWKKNNRYNDDDNNYYGDVHTLPCELFQRLPYGNWDTSLWNILGREFVSRVMPMRGCGVYGSGRCEITRHKGKASWAKAGGTLI